MNELEANLVIPGQLVDAQHDLKLWLATANSEEERAYVREAAVRLGYLHQILDRSNCGRLSEADTSDWSTTVSDFLRLFKRAKEVRGCVVGKSLSRFATHLDSQTGSSTTKQRASNGKARNNNKAAVDEYIAEVFEKTGKKITKKDIWVLAGYGTRTEFERWQRNDRKRRNPSAASKFSKIISEKPHLK